MIDTAECSDGGWWETHIACALALQPALTTGSGGPVYHLCLDDCVVLMPERDIAGRRGTW